MPWRAHLRMWQAIDRRYYAICSECSDAKFRTEQADGRQRFEKAAKVSYADYKGGMLFVATSSMTIWNP